MLCLFQRHTLPHLTFIGLSQVHGDFETIGTIDCAHLRVVTQGQMCTLTAYDANKEIMPMCYAVFPTETARNWERFTTHIFTLFPAFSLIISDGSKGLETLNYLFTRNGTHPFPHLLSLLCYIFQLVSGTFL